MAPDALPYSRDINYAKRVTQFDTLDAAPRCYNARRKHKTTGGRRRDIDAKRQISGMPWIVQKCRMRYDTKRNGSQAIDAGRLW